VLSQTTQLSAEGQTVDGHQEPLTEQPKASDFAVCSSQQTQLPAQLWVGHRQAGAVIHLGDLEGVLDAHEFHSASREQIRSDKKRTQVEDRKVLIFAQDRGC